MNPRRDIDESENPDRWVVSYADFLTLLFAFFTALYAISRVDAGKMDMFRGSLDAAFGKRNPENARISPVFEGGNALEYQLRAVITPDLAPDIRVSRQGTSLAVSFGGDVLFDSGKAEVKPHAAPVLASIGAILKKTDNRLVVGGHTDNLPTARGSRFVSNWDLSFARANSVIRYLVNSCGIDPARLAGAGYGEFRPAASNQTPQGRAGNRRVEIVILSKPNQGRVAGGDVVISERAKL